MATEAYHLESDGWHSFIDNHIVEAPTPPPHTVFGAPGSGNVYYGLTVDSLASRESFIGQRVGATRRYYQIDTSDNALAAATSDLAQGRVPWLSYKLKIGSSQVATWAQFAAGTQDSWWSGHMADLAALGKGPIMVTIHAEPNGDGQPAADHKAMYTHAKTFTDNYPQIHLTPCLSWNYYDVAVVNPKVVYSDWATAAQADIFGFNSYNHISYNPANGKNNLNVNQIFGLQAAQLRALDATVPWAVSEWGVRTNPNVPGQAATQMQDLFDYARTNNCFALTFFDSALNVNDGGGPWDLDDTTDGTDGTERVNKFKAICLLSTSVNIPPGGIDVP